MGDAPPDSGIGPGYVHLPADFSHDEANISATQLSSSQQSSIPPRLGGNQPFLNQFSSIPSFQQRGEPHRTHSHHGQPPYNLQQPGQQQQPGSQFNTGAMTGALPEYGSGMAGSQFQSDPQSQPQRRLSGASTPAVVYQLQQSLQQYPPAAGASGFSNQTPYSGFCQNQFQSGYGQAQGQQSGFNPFPRGQPHINTMQQQQQPQYPQLSPQYYYYSGGYSGQTPQSPFGTQFLGGFIRVGGQATGGVLSPTGQMPGFGKGGTAQTSATEFSGSQRQGPESAISPIPRGPPRKPKQSGHALWVGNLPPGATIMDLKDHFSRDAMRDIESLFLISKSNCAFVNYRTEAACAAAMQRFHDSRFQGVRLVCRLRRSSAPSPGVPTGPSAMSGRRASQGSSTQKSPLVESKESGEEEAIREEPIISQPTEAPEYDPSVKVPEKFFVIKSLTLQDLEQSVRTGIWATQSHNEEILNKAYETADNVYLIFSANKSGEYFGYARMTSSILEESAAAEVYRQIPHPEAAPEPVNAPRTIPTQATETAPRGHIIDDSARGTIFWEAELTDEEEERSTLGAEDPTADMGPSPEPDPSSQAWGKPFRVEWLSTVRLPFYRTRGLRNPWNANREVKIARDGTELETNVGKRLVQMFHRMGPPAAGVGLSPAQMQMPPYGGGMPGPSQQYYRQ